MSSLFVFIVVVFAVVTVRYCLLLLLVVLVVVVVMIVTGFAVVLVYMIYLKLAYGCLLFYVGYNDSWNNNGHHCCFCYDQQQL